MLDPCNAIGPLQQLDPCNAIGPLQPMWGCILLRLSTKSRYRACLAARRDLGACVVQKQRMPVWEAKRQAVQSQLERERSEPPGQVLHEAVLRAMLPGLEGLEGVGPEKAKQLMQARVNQSCSQFWPVKLKACMAFGENTPGPVRRRICLPADASIDRTL